MDERDASGAEAPLPGIAGLADRSIDRRRAALVVGLLAIGASLGCAAMVEHLLASANTPPPAAARLRRAARPPPAPLTPPSRLCVLLIDGLRVDEAPRLASWRRLRRESAEGVVVLVPPTLSRPFYHHLFTGVPSPASGVRTNRFDGPARHDSLMDRVRAAGGRVFFVADGLDWMRRMHGRPGDGGSDAHGSVDDLDGVLRALAAAPAPSLLVVHPTRVDGSAHADDAAAHAAALRQADRVLARLSEAPCALVALSDHGHVLGGGHGGPEPTVARAPLLIRAVDRAPIPLHEVAATRLAATLATLLGVERPRHALGPSILAPRAPDPGLLDAAVAVDRGVLESRLALEGTRRWAWPLLLVLAVLALGPIKRAFGFDRAIPIALALWPIFVLGGHLALGRPLSLSAIDEAPVHVGRVALLGIASLVVTASLAAALARGPFVDRARRVLAALGWSILVSASVPCVAAGFALGPWPLSPRAFYLPLLAAGAAAPALAAVGALLVATSVTGPRR